MTSDDPGAYPYAYPGVRRGYVGVADGTHQHRHRPRGVVVMVSGKGAHPESGSKRWPGVHGAMENLDAPPSPSGPAAARRALLEVKSIANL